MLCCDINYHIIFYFHVHTVFLSLSLSLNSSAVKRKLSKRIVRLKKMLLLLFFCCHLLGYTNKLTFCDWFFLFFSFYFIFDWWFIANIIPELNRNKIEIWIATRKEKKKVNQIMTMMLFTCIYCSCKILLFIFWIIHFISWIIFFDA